MGSESYNLITADKHVNVWRIHLGGYGKGHLRNHR
jgi:hypothetical protein